MKSQSRLYQVIVYGCIALIAVNFFMNVWGYNAILNYKLNNPKNIIETCAYFRGESKSKNSSGYYLNVDNYIYDTQRIRQKAFRSGLTWRDFYESLDKQPSKCHKIKYVQVDSILSKKIFIYDYHK